MIACRAGHDTRRNYQMPQPRARLIGLRLRQGRADDGPVTPFGARLQFVRSDTVEIPDGPADDGFMSEVRVITGEWIQNRSRKRKTAFTWGALATFGALGFVACLAGAVERPGLLLFAVIFGAYGYGSFRIARGSYRAGLLVGTDEILVRNPFKTVQLPRRAVERFVTGGQTYGFGNPVPGILVQLRDGSSVNVWTLAREGAVWNEKKIARGWDATADRLNALLGVGPVPQSYPSKGEHAPPSRVEHPTTA
jgi:hypothetical protein